MKQYAAFLSVRDSWLASRYTHLSEFFISYSRGLCKRYLNQWYDEHVPLDEQELSSFLSTLAGVALLLSTLSSFMKPIAVILSAAKNLTLADRDSSLRS